MAGENVFTFTDDNFSGSVIQASGPVLVDFWAPWCGPCKMIAPVIEEVANEFVGKIKVGKINTDENRVIPTEYGVMSIPTLIIYKDGNPIERVVGYKSKKELENIINKHI